MITRRHEAGFALPTILIVSVVMIIVLLASVQSIVNINIAINNDYYVHLADSAAQAGVVKAKECIRVNGTAGWTDANPLRPNTGCNGGAECTAAQKADATTGWKCYVLGQSNVPNVKTTFTVGGPVALADGSKSITVSSQVQLIRSSNAAVWKTYSGDARFIYGGSTTTAVQLSSVIGGQNSICALSVSNALYCLGSNGNYMLGTGDNALFSTPTFKQLHGDLDGKTITQVAVNSIHGCAIADSKVYCWGGQQNDALGTNVSGNALVPTAVYTGGALAGKTMTTVMTAGTGGLIGGITVYAHTCALDDAGNAYCWGANGNGATGGGQSGNGTVGGGNVSVPAAVVGGLQFKQSQIVGGSWHTCAIRTNGKLYCWGADNNGQIGNGTGVTHTGTPTQVQGTSILDLEYAGQTFNDITAGQAHNCAISDENKMWCWGQNAQGQLGLGNTTESHVARKVALPSGETGWKKVVAGTYWTCALTVSGKAYCWGGPSIAGNAPYIGDGVVSGANRTSPTAVVTSGVLSGKTLVDIWCTYSTVIAEDSNGKFYSWGANNASTLGTGDNSTPDAFSPILATHLNSFNITSGGSSVVIPF